MHVVIIAKCQKAIFIFLLINILIANNIPHAALLNTKDPLSIYEQFK